MSDCNKKQEKRVINFGAGPAKLPKTVLQQAQQELLNYAGTGISVMEMSHRSAEFMNIIETTENLLRDLLSIPSNYKVLFMQGGGSGQFAAVAMNLLQRRPDATADYLVTGSWSQTAAKQAEKYGRVRLVTPKVDKFTSVPSTEQWDLNPAASYLYFCDNETVHGVELGFTPDTGDVPLVCDMSSNFLSRPFDITKYGLVFAGAQKNVGCAGVTIVVVREDLLGHAFDYCPNVFNYKVMADHKSLFNTPPCYSIYIMGLVLQWIKDGGGLNVMATRSQEKSSALYELVDRSNGFYQCPVEAPFRSRMNCVLRILNGNEQLEKLFLEQAALRGLTQLKGHRSVGGLRASLYNAVKVEEALLLVDFMKEFMQANASLRNADVIEFEQKVAA